jgi:hypothetical protein
VTHEQQFEQRLADWLEDGPFNAPDRAIDAAVAHVRAHPRRRRLLGGLWRTVMSRMQPAPFPSSPHRSWVTAFAPVAVVAVVALAVVGGGALLLNRSPASQPAGAPGAAASPAPTATPAPTASTVEGLLDDLAAMASEPYDAAKVEALFAPTAVLYDMVANETSRGLRAIQAKDKAMDAGGFKVVVTSAWIQQDNFAAHFAKFGNTSELSGRGLVVYELKDGKVANQWGYDATSSRPVSSPATRSDEALVADLAAVAGSPYDAAKVAALYAPDAVLHELTDANLTSRGLEAIQARLKDLAAGGFKVVVTSAAIRQDNFVANFATFSNTGELPGQGLVVYELKDGKVLNQWVYPAP